MSFLKGIHRVPKINILKIAKSFAKVVSSKRRQTFETIHTHWRVFKSDNEMVLDTKSDFGRWKLFKNVWM